MTSQHRIAFWNVENLFDIEGSLRREEKVARAIGDQVVVARRGHRHRVARRRRRAGQRDVAARRLGRAAKK